MRLAISSNGPDLESAVDPRFGRCAYLTLVETETMEFEAFSNPNISAGGGAGIGTAQMVVDRGAEAVLTGNIGPNAFEVLNQAGIAVYTGVAGTVRQAVEDFKAGKMTTTSAPTAAGHFGMQAPARGYGGATPGPAPFIPGTGTGSTAGKPGPGPLRSGTGTGPGRRRGEGRGRRGCGKGGGPRW